MPYIKQTWVDGVDGATPLNEDRLNYIEAGIEEAAPKPSGDVYFYRLTDAASPVTVAAGDQGSTAALLDSDDSAGAWTSLVTWASNQITVVSHGLYRVYAAAAFDGTAGDLMKFRAFAGISGLSGPSPVVSIERELLPGGSRYIEVVDTLWLPVGAVFGPGLVDNLSTNSVDVTYAEFSVERLM